jgi:hypothetical protein
MRAGVAACDVVTRLLIEAVDAAEDRYGRVVVRAGVGGHGGRLCLAQVLLDVCRQLAGSLHPEVRSLPDGKIPRLRASQIGDGDLRGREPAADLLGQQVFPGQGSIEPEVLEKGCRATGDRKRQDQHKAEPAFTHGWLL